MLEFNQRSTVSVPRVRVNSDGQPRRVLYALVLLLVALAIVLVHDRQFWFGSDESTISDAPETQAAPQAAPQVTAKVAPQTAVAPAPASVPAAAAPAPATVPPAKKRIPAATKHIAQPKPPDSGIVATNRSTVTPLNVEVLAGGNHRTVHPSSNAVKATINAPAPAVPAQPANLATATNAAEREPLPTAVAAIQPPQGSYEATYPLLAQHMNVQGSVVLQALIGADGIIQEIRVLSGPAILTQAAEQAVRQWRFKPYLQNGKPVETKAKITVNFTIKVADNTARVS